MKKNKNKKNLTKRKRIKYIILFSFLALFIIGSIGGIVAYAKYGDEVKESIENGKEKAKNITKDSFNNKYPTVLLDKDGNVLKEFKSVNYAYKDYDSINKKVFEAFTSIEDERFYEHKGIDYKALLRAVFVAVKSGGKTIQGGSTITQQLTKNMYLSFDKLLTRKIEEMVIAREIENKFSKEEILEFYVNNINYGNGAYSIESASNLYFNKTVNDLTLTEIATLVAIPNNPTLFDPITNPNNTKERRDIILLKMKEQGYITEEEYNNAVNEEIKLNLNIPNIDNTVEDYAQSYAVYNVVETLMEQDGFIFVRKFDNDEDREDYFSDYQKAYDEAFNKFVNLGLKVETSIDNKIQSKIQEVVNEYLTPYGEINEENGLYMKQSAVTVIDNLTGEVVGIIGGRGEEGNTYNRAYLSARQPGSTIKPVVSYIEAYENGYLPESKVEDSPINNGPKNYDFNYNGMITIRYALEMSKNTIAYKLLDKIGAENSLEKLYAMNFKYLTYQDNNPIISVGGFTRGVTTVEMASAYSTFSRNGEYIKPTNIRKVTRTLSNEVIYENPKEKVRVFDSGASYLMNDTLKGVVSKSYALGKNGQLRNYKYVAGKTGTTDENKDVWFCGYTPYYSSSVWIGDDMPKQQYIDSGVTPAFIFRAIMEYLHEGLEVKDFEVPDTITKENNTYVSKIYKDKIIEQETYKNEIKRKEDESYNQLIKIENKKFLEKYGITKEESDERDNVANKKIDNLYSYKLVHKNQYEELDKLVKEAEESIKYIIDDELRLSLDNDLSYLKEKFSLLKKEIDKPVEKIIEKPKEEDKKPVNNENQNNKPIEEKPIEEKPNNEDGGREVQNPEDIVGENNTDN